MAAAGDPLPTEPPLAGAVRGGRAYSWAERCRYTALAIAVFAATCLCIHAIMPEPEITGVSSKLRFLAEHGNEYDTIFIGSSRVYHGIVPSVFDQTMAAAGERTRSFNIGVDGMWPPEQFRLIDSILRIQPRTWRWVFIELNDVQVKLPPGVEQTRRSVYWHDWSHTWIIFRKLLMLDVPEKIKRKQHRLFQWRSTLWMHTHLLLKNVTNVGSVSDIVGRFEGSAESTSTTDFAVANEGYAPVSTRLESAAAKSYEESVARDAAVAKPRTVDRYAEAEFLRDAQRFRASGATPIFFTSPAAMSILPTRFAHNPAPPVMAFNDANAYPSLYQADVRVDEGHLNAAGAEDYTRIFAERVLALEHGN